MVYLVPPVGVSPKIKGCTHRAMILCDGAVNSNNLKTLHSGNTYPLRLFAICDLKRHLKLLEMACDQVLTCLLFPLRWTSFSIKISRNAQWVHLFSMDFDEFLTIYLIF